MKKNTKLKKVSGKDSGVRKQGPNTDHISTTFLHNRYGTYPSSGLTPQKLAAYLKEADQGDISKQMELLAEIERKDPQIFSLLNRRKKSGVRRAWQCVAGDTNDAASKTHAEYVNKVLLDIKDFQQFRFDAMDAVGKGFSAHWIEWKIREGNYISIDRFHFVDQHKFRTGLSSDQLSDLNVLHLLTDANMIDGEELERNKWFIPVIKATSGDLAKTSLLRILVWNYLFKNFNIKAWVQFAEVYGIPLRIGKYGPGAGEKEKTDLLIALQTIAQDASAIISDSTKIEFIEAMTKAASFDSFEKLCDYLDKQSSKVILGHSASVDSTAGKLGSEDNAGDAIYDLIESDAAAFDNAFNTQVIIPLINFRFGPQKYYPVFKTIVIPPKDRKAELDLMNSFRQPIGKQHYYDTVGIPVPAAGEEVIMPAPDQSQFGNPFGQSVAAKHIAASESKKKL